MKLTESVSKKKQRQKTDKKLGDLKHFKTFKTQINELRRKISSKLVGSALKKSARKKSARKKLRIKSTLIVYL